MTAAPQKHVRIATRGSALAMWQANFIKGLLEERGVTSELLVIKTTADKVQDRFLYEIGGKGLFVKELEQALEAGDADLAVHSLKDMTATLKEPFTLAAVLPRHESSDAMIFRDDVYARLKPSTVIGREGAARLDGLSIGTGSLRRQALLKQTAPTATTVGVRGNVDTRLRKLQEGSWDALILAEASLDRLSLKAGLKVSRLDPTWFVPCASQGALALETLSKHPMTPWLASLGSAETKMCVEIERGLLARLGGDCTMPFGCHVAPETKGSKTFVGRAVILSRAGNEARSEHRGEIHDAAGAAAFLDAFAAKLKSAGAAKILGALELPIPAYFA